MNLANVHLEQGRFVDAEHLYNVTLKSIACSHFANSVKLATLSEYAALAQFKNKKADESFRSILRSIHYDPICLRLWYNAAVILHDAAISRKGKEEKSVAVIQDAIHNLQVAKTIFLFASTSTIPQSRGILFDKEVAQKNSRLCEVRFYSNLIFHIVITLI
jgi:hypothetical protein